MRGLGHFHTFVMLGDGETQEGMVWESVMVAARYGLGGLTAIVDCNGLQQYGWPVEPGVESRATVATRWRGHASAGHSKPSAGASWRSTVTTSRRSSRRAQTPGPRRAAGSRRPSWRGP